MPYRIRYQVNIDWVGFGAGPMEALNPTGGSLPGGGSNGQTTQIDANPSAAGVILNGSTTFTQPNGTTISGALASGDITTLLAGLSADCSTQLNARLATMQAWVAGNP
jgi:hypothetical protein